MVDGLLQKGEQHEEGRGPAQGVRGGGMVEARGPGLGGPWRLPWQCCLYPEGSGKGLSRPNIAAFLGS